MKNANKKISVIIPAYNAEKYLENTLKSICNQTYKNLEIIIINDGSTDSTLNIIETFANKDDRIIYKSKENGGQSMARNNGLELATGEYVGFVDADDLLDKHYFEYLFEAINLSDADMVYCNFKKINYNAKKFNVKTKLPLVHLVFDNKTYLKKLLTGNTLSPLATGFKLYKKSSLSGVRFNEEVFNGEDVLFNYQFAKKANAVAEINATLYGYVMHNLSASHAVFNPSRKLSNLPLLFNILKECEQNDSEFAVFAGTWVYLTIMEYLYRIWQAWFTDTKIVENLIEKLEYVKPYFKQNKDVPWFRKTFIPIGEKILIKILKNRIKKN